MKKSHIVIIILTIIVVILLGVCIFLFLKEEHIEEQYEDHNYIQENNTINNESDINKEDLISSESAIEVALKDLKVNRQDVYDLDNDLEYKFGTYVYEIDFKYNGFEYDYYINAKTGEIIKSFKERD